MPVVLSSMTKIAISAEFVKIVSSLKGHNRQHSDQMSQIFKTEKNDRNTTSQAN